ncbi:MAG: 3'-5' exonuclease [Firmicutes bacterium]|nr:3'-5' exonuclease [Bacillota bacterium]
MRYLFFDIECCDGHHICSFGFVTTDEKFNLLKKQDIVINPQKPFVGGCRGFYLEKDFAYTKGQFLAAKSFKDQAKTIFDLFNQKDQIIVAHAAENDIKFLIRACLRYNLKLPDFDFFDTQTLFSYIFDMPTKKFSLVKILQALNIEATFFQHKSDEDAHMVAQILDGLVKKTGKSAKELFERFYQCKGFVKNNKAYIYEENPAKIFKNHISDFAINQSPTDHVLSNKQIKFSDSFEKRDSVLRLWSLLNLMADKGGAYQKNILQSDIFVWDGDKDCKTYKLIADQKIKCQTVSIKEFCACLDTDWDSIPPKKINNYCPLKLPQIDDNTLKVVYSSDQNQNTGAKTALATAFDAASLKD